MTSREVGQRMEIDFGTDEVRKGSREFPGGLTVRCQVGHPRLNLRTEIGKNTNPGKGRVTSHKTGLPAVSQYPF